jgi:hypothetical protein
MVACHWAAAHGRDVNECDWWTEDQSGYPLGEGNVSSLLSWLRSARSVTRGDDCVDVDVFRLYCGRHDGNLIAVRYGQWECIVSKDILTERAVSMRVCGSGSGLME